MSSTDKLASKLYSLMKESDDRKPKPYDTTAEVVRVEEDTVWVHIEGGVEETPVKKTIDAKKGDKVRVHVGNGSAWITGNESAPPTDDTTAVYAAGVANAADEKAVSARIRADEATLYADIAKDEAIKAQIDAGVARNAAERAIESAETAEENAEIAMDNATLAQASADNANKSAHTALTQLGVIEDVVGTLNWISQHASYTISADTEVVDGKLYFTKNGNVYTLVVNPTGNPSQQGYYEIDEIDEAVSNYVSSHLALTNSGLWVINDNNSYRILLASDGMRVYDPQGNVISTFGESISFSSSKAQYIGGENAYIIFNPTTGSMSIGGSNLNISGNVSIGGETRSLSQVLIDMQAEIDGSIETWYYSIDPTTSNPPASNWTTEAQKIQHLRDLYFNTSNGHTFRWALISSNPNVYNWVEIEDSDAAAALRAAQAAQQTADGKVDPSSVIASINASSETSTINENRVNIAGAALFTSGRLSTDSLNDTYDAKGAASTAKSEAISAAASDATSKANTAKSEAISAAASDASSKANAAETTAKNYTDNKTSDMATNTGVANTYSTKSDTVKRTQRIYYQNNSTTAPATPGTASSNWVTDNTGAANKWTKKRMSYATATPYIWTCEQSENAAGTVSYTTVLLDDTTTVIDGGKIITGTVSANAVNANSGTFDTANIPNLSASKITSGTIAVSRLPSEVAMDTDVADAEKKATDFITKIDGDGIWVTPTNKKPTNTSTGTGATGTKIDGSGVGIYNNGTNVAQYGTNARIGQNNANNIQIDSSGTSFYKNQTKIGSINQVAYTPPIAGEEETNTMAIEAEKLMILDVGGYNADTSWPNITMTDKFINLTVGDTGLSMYDTGYPSNTNTRALLQLAMPNFAKANQDVLYEAYNEAHSAYFGISGGYVGLIKDTTWIIHMRSNNHVYMPAVYNNTGSNAPNVVVYGTGETVRSTSSSERYKKEIEDIENAEALYDVKVRQFKYRDDYLDSEDRRYNKVLPGFIVEELEEVYPIAVDYEDERPEDWNFRYIIPGMLKLIQDQHKKIDELESRIEALERSK